MISTDPWVWLSAFLTICSFTLLYGDNPLFRIGEYTYTATVVAHSVVTGIQTLRSRFLPLFTGAKPILIVPLILGIMSLFVVWKKYAWLASFPIAIMIGVGTGLSIRTLMATDVVGNINAVVSEAGKILVPPLSSQLGYFVRVVFTIAAVVYLLFTVFLRGPLSKPVEYIRTFGKYVFLAYLGLSVGNAVMQVSGLATSAINRLLRQWLGL
ncbi:hypothetical protein CW700_05415 [Candidatus Bathyarchaeota archaeon]|nr:MAG: hypothetical protein CW700_05415 [Candidatus Bathyarchaeota archaeon]